MLVKEEVPPMGPSSRCWKLTQKIQHTLLLVTHPTQQLWLCVLCISRTPALRPTTFLVPFLIGSVSWVLGVADVL